MRLFKYVPRVRLLVALAAVMGAAILAGCGSSSSSYQQRPGREQRRHEFVEQLGLLRKHRVERHIVVRTQSPA